MNKLETIVLENGLTIYLYPEKRRHSTLFQFVTYFGGLTKDFRYQEKEYHLQDGIAHILEHYLVECNQEGNFLESLGEMQMNTNASTSNDMTCFYFETIEKVEEGIQILLNSLNHVSFEKEKLEKLKNPIYQEIRGKLNNKFYHANLMALDQLFHHYTFRSIGGTMEEVEKTTVDDLKVCYDAFYQPTNQFIVIAGNFQRDRVLKTIQDCYQGYSFSKEKATILPISEELSVKKKEGVLYFPTSLDYVELTFKLDIQKYSPQELLDLTFYIHCFFNNTFGLISPLHKEFIEKGIITTSIHCDELFFDHFLLIQVGAYSYDCKKFKKGVLKAIQGKKDFSKEVFELEKKSAILRLILRDENIIDMIMPFIDNVVTFHYPYLDTVEDLESLNFQKYQEMIQELDFSNVTSVTIVDKEKES